MTYEAALLQLLCQTFEWLLFLPLFCMHLRLVVYLIQATSSLFFRSIIFTLDLIRAEISSEDMTNHWQINPARDPTIFPVQLDIIGICEMFVCRESFVNTRQCLQLTRTFIVLCALECHFINAKQKSSFNLLRCVSYQVNLCNRRLPTFCVEGKIRRCCTYDLRQTAVILKNSVCKFCG